MYSCTCNDDYEVAEFFKASMRQARKQYVCCECGEAIRPGDRYEYIKMIFAGKFEAHRTCGVCAAIAAAFQQCGRVPRMLWEDIHNANCVEHDSDAEYFCMCPGA
jgi:hypothetical protein